MRFPSVAVFALLLATFPARAQGPPRTGGLDVVPPTAFGFVTVRVSDLKDVEAFKPVWETLAKVEKAQGEISRVIGVTPDEVERVTMFWPTLPANPDNAVPVLVIS